MPNNYELGLSDLSLSLEIAQTMRKVKDLLSDAYFAHLAEDADREDALSREAYGLLKPDADRVVNAANIRGFASGFTVHVAIKAALLAEHLGHLQEARAMLAQVKEMASDDVKEVEELEFILETM